MSVSETCQTWRTFPVLTLEVGEWSHRNFGAKQCPYLGIIEELGELAHCVLKRFQGIRGYEDPEVFAGDYQDALGDICIYAANYCFNYQLVSNWQGDDRHSGLNHTKYLSNACYLLAHLPTTKNDINNGTSLMMNNFLQELEYLAQLEQMELAVIANITWEKVVTRDWLQNKTNGQG